MPKSHRVDEGDIRQGAIRPLVLLSIADDELRARFAYELTASGFDVTVTHVTLRRTFTARRPDVIVAGLDTQSGNGSLSASLPDSDSSVPVVALVPDVSDVTRDVARREGCAAVCLTTCTGTALAMGLRAVLQRTDAVSRTATRTFG
jgi:DNA-binding response OmpR family regulator